MQVNIEFGGDAVTQIGTAPAHHAIALAVRTVFSHFAASLNWASARRGRRPGWGRSARVAKPSALARIPSASHSNRLRQLEPLAGFAQSRDVCRSRPARPPAANDPDDHRQNAPRLVASAVRAAAARNREIRRSWRVISMAGMLPSPRINGMLHRLISRAIWDSPQESGSRAVGVR
jgi:hypothetical protein